MWKWISAKHGHFIKKFSDPDTDEDFIKEKILTMIKQYRNEKGNFNPDKHANVDSDKNNNKGKGKAAGSAPNAQPDPSDNCERQAGQMYWHPWMSA